MVVRNQSRIRVSNIDVHKQLKKLELVFIINAYLMIKKGALVVVEHAGGMLAPVGGRGEDRRGCGGGKPVQVIRAVWFVSVRGSVQRVLCVHSGPKGVRPAGAPARGGEDNRRGTKEQRADHNRGEVRRTAKCIR